jgi:AAA15 family ATPase/GTPase
MASKFFKAFNFFKGKVSPTIKSVKPTFPKTKMSQALRDVKITALKTKGSIKKGSQDLDRDIQKVKSKIGQTMQKLKGEPVTKSGVSKGKDLREKKMGGGMMGRRFGMKSGTPFKKKTNVEKIKETFGVKKKDSKQRMQAKNGSKKKFPDLTGDGKVTFADILKGRGVINGKKKKA